MRALRGSVVLPELRQHCVISEHSCKISWSSC